MTLVNHVIRHLDRHSTFHARSPGQVRIRAKQNVLLTSQSVHCLWHGSLSVTRFTGYDTVHWLWHGSLSVTRFTVYDTVHCLWHGSLFVTRFTGCDTVHWLWHGSLSVTRFTVYDTVHCLWHGSLFMSGNKMVKMKLNECGRQKAGR